MQLVGDVRVAIRRRRILLATSGRRRQHMRQLLDSLLHIAQLVEDRQAFLEHGPPRSASPSCGRYPSVIPLMRVRCPVVQRLHPARIFSSVDLPVPLPPTRPVRSSGVISQFTSSKRSFWPNRLPAARELEHRFTSIFSSDSRLVIETTKPGKLPLVFELANITLTDVGTNKPLDYDATLINPRPVGNIHSVGHFGPWQADDPRDTPIDGNYTFTHADLGPFKGIAGILSSTGKFSGKLDHINVEGETDTPDFRLDMSDHPVPLHTDFKAIVNGTTGDTTLTEVVARLQKSVFRCSGSVTRVGVPATGVTGHDVELTVLMDKGRMEDVLTLATKTSPPLLQGVLSLNQRLSIPPGKETVAKRMKLAGTFTVEQATFGNPKMQQKIDEVSMRAQGHPKAANAQDATLVNSAVTGEFVQANGTMNFSTLDYTIPGAVIKLKGWYKLQGNSFDFKGVVRTDATASQMTTGWKSMLLPSPTRTPTSSTPPTAASSASSPSTTSPWPASAASASRTPSSSSAPPASAPSTSPATSWSCSTTPAP
jgi:hypothetical protein